MKINWKLRLKNPVYWIGMIGIILAAAHIEPSTLTTWNALGQAFISIVQNPFTLAGVILAIVGNGNDPTIKGLSDSERALEYQETQESAK